MTRADVMTRIARRRRGLPAAAAERHLARQFAHWVSTERIVSAAGEWAAAGGKRKGRKQDMAELDRDQFIDLLNRLGDPDDQVALEAARRLHTSVVESGHSWNDLLHPGGDGTASPPVASSAIADDERTVDEPEAADADDSAEAETEAEAEEAPALPLDKSEDGRLLERLSARKGLSKTMRDELRDLRRSHAEGGLDAMDRRYIRALAKRLGV